MNALRALEVLKKPDPVLMYPASRPNIRCGGILVKTVELATGKKIFYPLHTFCYVDPHTSLQNLLYQAEFVTSSEHWRSRNTSDGLLTFWTRRCAYVIIASRDACHADSPPFGLLGKGASHCSLETPRRWLSALKG